MKKSLLFSFSLLLLTAKGFSQEYIPYYGSIVDQCSQANITNNLTAYEALGMKRRGTVSLQNTLDWLKNKYLGFGYTANQIQEDSYTYSGSTAVCKNLIVTKIGTVYPNSYVIICGHYDSIGGTGTNDNGSGLVSILETARLLQNIPTEYSIKFINFSGEEDGLKGSQHYVSSVVNGSAPKMDIRLVLNIDEVGGVAGEDNNTITCERDTSNSPSTNNSQSSIITDELMTCVGLYSPLNTLLSYAYSSDYMSFQSNNEIITGLFETNETTHKHTNSDLLIYMDPVYNFKVAKALIGATLHFSVAATSALSNPDFEANEQVRFYPNPSRDSLTVYKGILVGEKYTFSLIDIEGKTVLTKNLNTNSSTETIDVSTLSKGIYLGVLQTEKKKITKKIVLE